MARDDELTKDIEFKDFTNITVGIEMAPALTDIWRRRNETLYSEYAQTINNFTEIQLYNYISNGYSNLTFGDGK